MKNSADNVFQTIPVGADEPCLFNQFLMSNDFADNTRSAFAQDIRKFARWFAESNSESFLVNRVTTRDVTDFRNHLRRAKGQAVSTVNRALVTVRRFFGWLVDQDRVPVNPAKKVKELRRLEIGLQIGPTSGEKSACKSDPPYWTLESACLLGSFEVKNADSGRIRSDTSCSS